MVRSVRIGQMIRICESRDSASHLLYDLPGVLNVLGLSRGSTDTESEEVDSLGLRGHDVNSSVCIDSFIYPSIEFIVSLIAEADETHQDLMGDFKQFTASHQLFKLLGKRNLLSDVSLESGKSVQSQDKPEFN